MAARARSTTSRRRQRNDGSLPALRSPSPAPSAASVDNSPLEPPNPALNMTLDEIIAANRRTSASSSSTHSTPHGHSHGRFHRRHRYRGGKSYYGRTPAGGQQILVDRAHRPSPYPNKFRRHHSRRPKTPMQERRESAAAGGSWRVLVSNVAHTADDSAIKVC